MALKHIGRIDTPYGPGRLCTAKYGNGAVAVVIEPQIAVLSVNLAHGQPCAQSDELPEGHFYVDTNNLGEPILTALRASGHFVETDLPHGVSGYCSYPVWKLAESA